MPRDPPPRLVRAFERAFERAAGPPAPVAARSVEDAERGESAEPAEADTPADTHGPIGVDALADAIEGAEAAPDHRHSPARSRRTVSAPSRVAPFDALEPYAAQRARWPDRGRVILAHHDEARVVVYQAFHAVTAAYAVEHQRFGGPRYSWTRMSWVKPNFLWMMYRCDWLQADEDQGRVLAITLDRAFFDALLEAAVPSTHDTDRWAEREDWQRALKASDVRLQWDPDHTPTGGKTARRAVQLGLRGETLRRFGTEAIRRIDDVSDFVVAERAHRKAHETLLLPRETVYPVTSPTARAALGLDRVER